MSFRIVGIDNLNRENVSEFYSGSYSITTREYAQQLADSKNKKAGPDASTWYVVRPADQPLYIWEP